jgi:hypothetical protein
VQAADKAVRVRGGRRRDGRWRVGSLLLLLLHAAVLVIVCYCSDLKKKAKT